MYISAEIYILFLMSVQWPFILPTMSASPRDQRENDRGNLHPGRVILYRPVASNRHDTGPSEPQRTHPFPNPHRDKNQGEEVNYGGSYRSDRKVDRDYPRSSKYQWDRDRTKISINFRQEQANQQDSYHNNPRVIDRNVNTYSERRRDYDKGKRTQDSTFLLERVSKFRPEQISVETAKLLSSKYRENVKTPARPAQRSIQNRNSFLFPGDNDSGRGTIWAPRGTIPYTNIVDYLPRDRHRFHSAGSLGSYNNDNERFKERSKPGLHDRNVERGIPIQGPGIIVASGPGGVRHVIHDLRVPVQTHVHHEDKTQTSGQDGRFTSSLHNPYGSINQAYKGVPIYLEGGPAASKEYDPRFIALYRQVLEENQHRLITGIKEKGHAGLFSHANHFHSSPSINWFSEPDPLYHTQTTPLLAIPHLQLTTGLAYDSELQSTTGAALEPQSHAQSTTGAQFVTQLHATTGTGFEVDSQQTLHTLPEDSTAQSLSEGPNQPSTSIKQQILPPIITEPTDTPVSLTPELASTSTSSASIDNSHANHSLLQETASLQPSTPEDHNFGSTIPNVKTVATPTIPGPTGGEPASDQVKTLTQIPKVAPDPIDEVVVSTSISQSFSANRPIRERNNTENLVPKETSTNVNLQPTEENQFTVTEKLPVETSPMSEIVEVTTHSTTQSISSTLPAHDTQIAPTNNNIKVKLKLKDDTTTYRPLETTTTQTESQTSLDDTSEPNETLTQPTTTATELALTTLNYLVMSLVNHVQANKILEENSTVPS